MSKMRGFSLCHLRCSQKNGQCCQMSISRDKSTDQDLRAICRSLGVRIGTLILHQKVTMDVYRAWTINVMLSMVWGTTLEYGEHIPMILSQ